MGYDIKRVIKPDERQKVQSGYILDGIFIADTFRQLFVGAYLVAQFADAADKIAVCYFKDARLTGQPVSNTVPSANTMRTDRSTLSLLACVPQFIPEALFMTMPPTIALFTEAGSGANLRP